MKARPAPRLTPHGREYSAHVAHAVSNVLRLYAIPGNRGLRSFLRCAPTVEEQARHLNPDGAPEDKGNTGKVCFADRRDAEGAARDINGLPMPEIDEVEAYECPRGHWHHRNG